MSNQIPTLRDIRPISSVQVRHIVGQAPKPEHYAYHQTPTAMGARSGTLTVLKDRPQKGHKPNYVPGADIPVRSRQPTDTIGYTMKIGAEAAGVPDLEAQASQLGGDGQMQGVQKAQQRMREVARETSDKMRLMMNGREAVFDVFLYEGTWNSGSTALLGADSWLNINADIPAHLQQMTTDLNVDEGLTLTLSRPVWKKFQINLALRSGLPTDMHRHLLTEETAGVALQKFGIERVVVSKAAYTQGGSDYIMRNAAYLSVSTDVDEVIGQGESVNPSAFWRLCEDLRPDGRHDVGSRINFGDKTKRMWDFYIRQGRRESAISEIVQILYAETFVPCRADKLIRYTMA